MVALDHVTLRTDALKATRDFFIALLDLTVGYRPDFGFPGYWLYAGDRPIVHLISGPGGAAERDAETIDHTAFIVDDYAATRDRLEAMGLQYSPQDLPELGEQRLFTFTPTGILIELVACSPGGLANNPHA
ncbi:VOC family protein [Salinisphaera sp. LB1]|uniref:VOC family protein n=1 Tax=Salinisphaera sp. LB1 TaxID=2183911 RepID=UPI000D70682F|nr:VOC family protein [Salinisphaera sp. LB1]AWN14255.1 putative dioxygenase [Salinisphaera sp. LB1]